MRQARLLQGDHGGVLAQEGPRRDRDDGLEQAERRMVGPDHLGDAGAGFVQGRQAGQRQHLAAADGDVFPPKARQAEDNLGLRLATEDGVGPRIRRGRVAQHGEASLARLEALFLLVNAGLGAPPPLAMHERAVGGVHQADHRVVDMGVEVHPVDQLGAATDHAGEFRRRMVRLRPWCASQPDPHQALAFRDRIAAHAEAAGVQVLARRQRGDGDADAVRAEPPAVVGAFDGLKARILAEPAGGERRCAVRADVAQREQCAVAAAAQHDRLAKQLDAGRAACRKV